MNNIDIFTTGVVGVLFGLLMVIVGGSSLGASVGLIIFCYGVAAIGYSAYNKLMGRDIV